MPRVHCLCSSELTPFWSPFRDIVVGKIPGERKTFGVGGKNCFQMFCVLWQNFCVPSRNFAFPRKTFAFSRKYICVLSQNQLSLNCLLYSLQWFIQLRMFSIHRVYFELGLKYKEIQSVLSSRHVFWTF